MARCDTPSDIARCFSSPRNFSKLAPLWQEAARSEGAEAGRCGAGPGRATGANCANAADENASTASAAVIIRGRRERGIRVPGRAQVSLGRKYPNRREKGNPAAATHPSESVRAARDGCWRLSVFIFQSLTTARYRGGPSRFRPLVVRTILSLARRQLVS